MDALVWPATVSAGLAGYLPAFQGHEAEPFLTFYPVSPAAPDQTAPPPPSTLTRGQLWALASRLARALTGEELGLAKGDRVVHLFSGNSSEDVALRLAAAMVGTVPVTVNWDSDPVDRVVYKVRSSGARLVLTHARTPAEQAAAVAGMEEVQERGTVRILSVDALLAAVGPGEGLRPGDFDASLGEEDTRIIIYTSGSSGEPKGVRLPYRSYDTNRATFESFLQLTDPAARFTPVLVNPLHHTNSTALSDWALRRPGTHLHLFERYTTGYWATVTRVALGLAAPDSGSDAPIPADPAVLKAAVDRQVAAGVRLVCPTVSRHFDFLEALVEDGRLPVDPAVLRIVAPVVTFLIGSAPVGPGTVTRLMKYLGRLPTVRFGSTETCLQVMGTPFSLSQEATLEAFQRGWDAGKDGGGDGQEQQQQGFYVGRPHPPYTKVMVVRGIDPSDPATYLKECPEGARGYLVTRGRNLMAGYVQGEEATRKAIHAEAGGWYTNLGDIFFWLANAADGARDYYWVTRTSNLLIRGGTNYSYDQVSAELAKFVAAHYGLPPASFAVAAVGVRLTSEHDDDCLVTIDLLEPSAQARRQEIEASFVAEAKKAVSKGAKPSRVRIAPIPRNFKGDINWRSLEAAWKAEAAAATAGDGK